ncbi:flagellar basal body-associated FliL family protein [Blastopirellula sp. JC732]|uniref:Flagellar protein FliL n=1 Tax=Blastopirellula sediminis TaxID=2894196 RepID=A0A9X1SI04_9BACT|nr:flagellar basal body-associated FliL family protein [Blastopirellula sediminis]MCC9605667.1 flagellar basal body-associated FliL family protein [Blastopirellula sediminis]MCC9631033.1 flagellar basal body-associated FliL family protein [Blastopirellula sediminis]
MAGSTPNNSAGPSLVTKLKILGAVLALVGLECLLAYFVIPSPEDVIEAAEMRARQHSATEPDLEELTTVSDKATVEIALKPFGITAYQPLANTTLRIDFQLYMMVNAENQSEFEALLAQNEHRLREQVIVTLRSSEVSDLTDPSLGLLKRKILEKTNRILGKPLVKSVIFSDYSFIEQ